MSIKQFKPTLEQIDIFNFFGNQKGNGIIDAVAGSGKTSTLIEGIKYIKPSNKILFCAFNKKIQSEIHQETKNHDNVIVKTTYALGKAILVQNNKKFKNLDADEKKYPNILKDFLSEKNNSTVANEVKDAFNNLKLVFDLNLEFDKNKKEEEEINNDLKDLSFEETFNKNIKKLLSLTRLTLSYNRGIERVGKIAEYYGLDINLSNEDEIYYYNIIINNVIKRGIDICEESIDFADMIFLPNYFNYEPFTKYDIVFIDECQDLSNAQLKVVLKFTKRTGRIFAVGDPYQSIYGFAGASPQSFENIKKIIKPKEFKLTNCFRCAKEIVEIAKSIRNDISTTNDHKGEIFNIKYYELFSLVNNKDYILSRFNKDLVFTFFKLINLGKSCKIIGKEEIIQEISDFIPKKFHNNNKYYQNLDEKVRKLNKQYQSRFNNDEERLTIYEGIKDVILFCYLKFNNLDNFHELLQTLKNLFEKEDENSIILSSIHRSKGLQSESVFILSYEQLPYKPSRGTIKEWQIYQEKCLKYVAITRAKNKLFMVESLRKQDTDISRLITDLQMENQDSFDSTAIINVDDIDNLPL